MPARTRIMIITATSRLASHVEADHGCPGIELTHALAGQSFHHHGRRSQEGVAAERAVAAVTPGKSTSHRAASKLQASGLAFRLDNVDHVNPVRQGCV